MTEMANETNRGIEKLPQISDSRLESGISAAKFPPEDAQKDERDIKLPAWERPGVWGATRRFLRTIQRYIWDDPDKPKAEKLFLFKLDFFLLTYGCLGYFCKNLDQANIRNAYVSGMKEALHMGGSQLTYMENVFTAGYVVSQLPAVILATKIRPSLLIPTLEVLWSVFTFCSAAVKSVPQLYALRFLIGLCEGAFFPVIIYVIGSWYTKQERAKRTALFYCTATLAGMFSGYLQAAAYRNLDGKLGHSGWQWLFIICGIISLPVGILGYFFNPDFPENTRAFYLSKSEVDFARQRLLHEGYKPLGASAWDRTKLFRIMAQWQFWVLPLGYFFVQASFPNQQPAYALWLKSEGYSIYQINVWPTGQAAIGVVVQVVAGMLSDSKLLRGNRWQAISVMQGGTFFAVIVLAVWNVPRRLKLAAFYLSYCSAGVPGIWYAWYPDLIPHDHEMRGFLIAASNMCGYINSIWYSDAVWRTAEGPRFRPGWIAASSFGVVIVMTTLLVHFLGIRDGKIRARVNEGRLDLESPGTILQEGEKGSLA
ncbi:Pantothenate transporter liz1 [Lachnellula cervina]|uniref:Pantothenate transporter liz1 n=1 Tax=Lachnellula cervina TaxID=1316786 RepID=A0A7D8YXM0_9HELO|nr:Pantothenate transporter liz1 [Lachnellula cervina]